MKIGIAVAVKTASLKSEGSSASVAIEGSSSSRVLAARRKEPAAERPRTAPPRRASAGASATQNCEQHAATKRNGSLIGVHLEDCQRDVASPLTEIG